jgi:hypothetical protein
MENALSTYGRINSILSSIFVGVIGIIFISIAIYFITKPKREGQADGKVVQIYKDKNNNNNIKVLFNVGKQVYYFQTQSNLGLNDKVDVVYNVKNPTDARLSTGMSNKTIGFIILVIAILAMGITFTITYFTMKSKKFAAVEGGLDVAEQVSRII